MNAGNDAAAKVVVNLVAIVFGTDKVVADAAAVDEDVATAAAAGRLSACVAAVVKCVATTVAAAWLAKDAATFAISIAQDFSCIHKGFWGCVMFLYRHCDCCCH